MQNKIFRFFLLPICLLTRLGLYAQDNEVVKGTMRSNGKIYVVLAICITILVGLFLYLVNIDRKISRIEDKQ
jgi:hypothetical protein